MIALAARPVRKVQAAESRVPGASRGQHALGVLASTEPQKLCRVLNPKGWGKRVKRGNPPRCNLRMGRYENAFSTIREIESRP